MASIPLIRASAVIPFVKFLNQLGSPTDRLLQQAGLPISALNNPEALVPLYQCFAFGERAARFEGIENLGIIVGQQTPFAQMGGLAKLACQSLTLYDLLHTLTQLIHTYNSEVRVWLTQQGEQMWLNHQFLCTAKVQNQQAQYFSLQMYLNALQLVMGERWQPDQLYTPASAVKGLASFAAFSATPIEFNHSHNAIGFSASLLSLPLRSSSQRSALKSSLDVDILQASAPSSDFSEALQQLIRSLMSDGYPRIELAAAAAGMSMRSMQRRLTEVGLSYSKLVEQVRFQTALDLLQDPNIKLIEIAAELGYTDAANFTHAFKRWTGVSPRKYRHLHFKQ